MKLLFFKMPRYAYFCVFTWLILAPSKSEAGIIVYNALTEFGIANNPNGVWTYGYGSTPNSGFTPFPDSGTGFFGPYWTNNSFGLANIAFWRNDTWNGGLGVPLGPLNPNGESWLVMHPGSGAGFNHIFLRFTAQIAGVHTIDLDYLAGDNGAVEIWVLHNGSLANPLFHSGVTLAGGDFGSQITLAEGDILDLAIGNAGSHLFDSTPVRFTISVNAIPEPGSGLLVLTGAISLGLFHIRQRRRR